MKSDILLKASLITLCIMVLGMVLIGGLTRLTGSGLSIVEWKPVTGMVPPLTQEDWMKEFSKYQQSAEFQKINFGMTLEDFQSIFLLEYVHRLWGRLIGFVLLVPTILAIFNKRYKTLFPFLGALWVLGLAQGIMGWFMVKSGLTQDPHVSPYRLSAHLFLGFIIFGVTLWTTFLLYKNKLKISAHYFPQKNIYSLEKGCLVAFFLVLLTALFGAFVAGLKAGLIYNTFPFMGDNIIPSEFLTQSSVWKDIFENPVSVQFLHRLCALTTVLFCGGFWIYQRSYKLSPLLTLAFNGMIITILAQVCLGIVTLTFLVPISLALLHQGMAFIVLGWLLYLLFIIRCYESVSLNSSNLSKTPKIFTSSL